MSHDPLAEKYHADLASFFGKEEDNGRIFQWTPNARLSILPREKYLASLLTPNGDHVDAAVLLLPHSSVQALH